MAKLYNLFISHSWTYSDAYEKLCKLLDKDGSFQYRNYSVPKDDPVHDAANTAELYAAIKAKIAPSSVVVIMAGKYATYSKWIEREIKIAAKEFSVPKPILGIRPWGNTQVSSLVAANADQVVGWNTKSIVTAIGELAK